MTERLLLMLCFVVAGRAGASVVLKLCEVFTIPVANSDRILQALRDEKAAGRGVINP